MSHAFGTFSSASNVETRALREEIKRRGESFRHKEMKFRKRIDLLEEEIRVLKATKREDKDVTVSKMDMVRRMHKALLKNVKSTKAEFGERILESETDLMRTFKLRTKALTDQLDAEHCRAAKNPVHKRMKEECEKLSGELKWTQDFGVKMERANQRLAKHNLDVTTQYEQHRKDRALLIEQLLLVKRDNAMLRTECLELRKRYAAAEAIASARSRIISVQSPSPSPTSSVSSYSPKYDSALASPTRPSNRLYSPTKVAARDTQKLERIVAQQAKLVEKSQRRERQARKKYVAAIEASSELERFLRACVEDVKRDVACRSILPRTKIDPADFDAADRDQVLQILLSKKRVVELLYERTFGGRSVDDGGGGDEKMST